MGAGGKPSEFNRALEWTKLRGAMALKYTLSTVVAAASWRTVARDIAIAGSRCGCFRPAVDLLSSRRVDVCLVIAAGLDLMDRLAAMEAARSLERLKMLLTPNPRSNDTFAVSRCFIASG